MSEQGPRGRRKGTRNVQLGDCNPDASESEGSSQPSQKRSFYVHLMSAVNASSLSAYYLPEV